MASVAKLFTPGIHLVDKPSGPSSHMIVNYFRKQSGISRIGHTGTLDPLASGLLIILVGREYTRLQEKFLKQDKEYLVTALLGSSTDSYDCTGTITQSSSWERVATIEKKDVKKALLSFCGTIQQQAPAFSAIKQQGQKLYSKARLGQVVIPPFREVRIKKIILTDFEKDVKKKKLSITLTVACSSGTYIRSLIHDLGKVLGVGAHIISLKRIKIGKQQLKHAQAIPGFIWLKKAPDRKI